MITKWEFVAGLLVGAGAIGAFAGFVVDNYWVMGVGLLVAGFGFASNRKD